MQIEIGTGTCVAARWAMGRLNEAGSHRHRRMQGHREMYRQRHKHADTRAGPAMQDRHMHTHWHRQSGASGTASEAGEYRQRHVWCINAVIGKDTAWATGKGCCKLIKFFFEGGMSSLFAGSGVM